MKQRNPNRRRKWKPFQPPNQLQPQLEFSSKVNICENVICMFSTIFQTKVKYFFRSPLNGQLLTHFLTLNTNEYQLLSFIVFLLYQSLNSIQLCRICVSFILSDSERDSFFPKHLRYAYIQSQYLSLNRFVPCESHVLVTYNQGKQNQKKHFASLKPICTFMCSIDKVVQMFCWTQFHTFDKTCALFRYELVSTVIQTMNSDYSQWTITRSLMSTACMYNSNRGCDPHSLMHTALKQPNLSLTSKERVRYNISLIDEFICEIGSQLIQEYFQFASREHITSLPWIEWFESCTCRIKSNQSTSVYDELKFIVDKADKCVAWILQITYENKYTILHPPELDKKRKRKLADCSESDESD